MVRCPNCKKEVARQTKIWKHGHFRVQAYSCTNCKTQFREYYDKDGKHSFTLKYEEGKGYRRA